MDSRKPFVLSEDATLVGESLDLLFRYFKKPTSSADETLRTMEVRFKKKEPIDSIAKSVLKHRIQTITGKSMAELETTCGSKLEDVAQIKRFARLAILHASNNLAALPESPKPEQKRKRQLPNEEAPSGPSSKRGRRSLAVTPASTSGQQQNGHGAGIERRTNPVLAARKSSRRSVAPEMLRTERKDDKDILKSLGPNPTPQMIAQKRRSMAVVAASKNKSEAGSISFKEPTTPPSKKTVNKTPLPKTPIPVVQRGKKRLAEAAEAPAKIAFSGEKDSSLLLVEADVSKTRQMAKVLDHANVLQASEGKFTGAHLTVVHTPAFWGAMDLFTLIQSIKSLNKKCGLENYLVLVGCGISNIHLLREAIQTFTKRVQLVTFELTDTVSVKIVCLTTFLHINSSFQNLRNPDNDHFLRETTSQFLLAYFYPDCLDEDKRPEVKMVRPGLTTCFCMASVEELENSIVHAMSEEGDWILDLCCGGRELSLAAQKSGRNALAIDGSLDKLNLLKDKATAIAAHHDKNFRANIDGKILKF